MRQSLGPYKSSKMNYLTITSKNVYLRPLSSMDSERLFSYRSIPEVAKYQLWKPVKLSEATSFIKSARFETELINHKWNQFAVCLHENDEMVGDIGILLRDNEAEIGYTIDPHFQRKGIAIESVTSLLKYLFKNYHVNRIIAYTDPQNLPSINLLKKIGFQLDSYATDEIQENNDIRFILNQNDNLAQTMASPRPCPTSGIDKTSSFSTSRIRISSS